MPSRDYNVYLYFNTANIGTAGTGQFWPSRASRPLNEFGTPSLNICKIDFLRISQATNLEHEGINTL